MGRHLRVLAASAMLMLTLSATARATSVPGPSSMSTGFDDFSAFQQVSPSAGALWFSRARALGARTVRLTVYWSSVAPHTRPPGFQASNPGAAGYDWSSLDEAVRNATAAGMNPVLMVLEAPTWAEGPQMPGNATEGAWEPSPQAFAAFGHAIALRYSGRFADPLHRGRELPLVSYFQAWNEPNSPDYLEPQWVQEPNGSIVPQGADSYRSLLNAFYAAVKAVQPAAFVLAAGTVPYGDPPGVNRTPPLVFLREMFCLTSTLAPKACPDPPHLDALDHHPYGIGPTVKARRPDDVALPDLDKIWQVLHAAERTHHVLPAGPKSLWVTEIDWSTSPPAPVTQAVQAAYLSEGLYELWSQNISHVYWFQLRDPPGATNSFAGVGLYFGNGVAKLATAAFRFPFVALPVPHNKRSVILWGKAPVAGTVAIQERVGPGWRTVRTMATTAGGIFYAVPRLSPRLQLRARIGTFTSLPWING
jgi:hypothetical protein